MQPPERFEMLMETLEDAGVAVPREVRRAVDLTVHAVAGGYPVPVRPITAPEYETAVEITEAVVRWAETHRVTASWRTP